MGPAKDTLNADTEASGPISEYTNGVTQSALSLQRSSSGHSRMSICRCAEKGDATCGLCGGFPSMVQVREGIVHSPTRDSSRLHSIHTDLQSTVTADCKMINWFSKRKQDIIFFLISWHLVVYKQFFLSLNQCEIWGK